MPNQRLVSNGERYASNAEQQFQVPMLLFFSKIDISILSELSWENIYLEHANVFWISISLIINNFNKKGLFVFRCYYFHFHLIYEYIMSNMSFTVHPYKEVNYQNDFFLNAL